MLKAIASFGCALALGLVGCSAPRDAAQSDGAGAYSWPGKEWAISTPEAEGLNPEPISRFIAELRAEKYGLVDHFVLIRNGRIVADETFARDYAELVAEVDPKDLISPNAPYDQYDYDNPNLHPFYNGTQLHSLQSVTKSVTSAALGVALDDGLIESTSVPAMPFFKDYTFDQSDPRKGRMTLDDLLTMRSGIDWKTEGGYAEGHSTVTMENSAKWIQFILDQPMDEEPGAVYEYNDGASVLIGKILREATGKRADEWARRKLFAPIGIDEFHWKITPDGEADTEGGLYLSAHDLARVGYLFLRGGEWNGTRVLSQDWVERSVKPIVADTGTGDPSYGYGYQWWAPDQAQGRSLVYTGLGYGGQYLLVFPEHDLVAVVMGWTMRGEYESSQTALRTTVVPEAVSAKP